MKCWSCDSSAFVGGSQNYINNKLACTCDTNTNRVQVMPRAKIDEIPDNPIRCAGCNMYEKPGSGSLMQRNPTYMSTRDDYLNFGREEGMRQENSAFELESGSHSSHYNGEYPLYNDEYPEYNEVDPANGIGERFLAGATAVRSGILNKAKHLKNRMTGVHTKTAVSITPPHATEKKTTTVVTPRSPSTVGEPDVAKDGEDDDNQEKGDEDGGDAVVAATDDEKNENDDDKDENDDDKDENDDDKDENDDDKDENDDDKDEKKDNIEDTAFSMYPEGLTFKNALSAVGNALLHGPGNVLHMMTSMQEPCFESDDDYTALHRQPCLDSTHPRYAGPYTGRDDPRLLHMFNPIPYSGRHVNPH